MTDWRCERSERLSCSVAVMTTSDSALMLPRAGHTWYRIGPVVAGQATFKPLGRSPRQQHRTTASSVLRSLLQVPVATTFLKGRNFQTSAKSSYSRGVAESIGAFKKTNPLQGDYKGLPPINSLHLRTSGGMTPSFRKGIFSDIH